MRRKVYKCEDFNIGEKVLIEIEDNLIEGYIVGFSDDDTVYVELEDGEEHVFDPEDLIKQ